MATTRQIPREQWKDYFEQLTQRHLRPPAQHRVSIETISMERGDQHDVDRAPLVGIAWDEDGNILEVVVAEAKDDFEFTPDQIWVIEEDDGFATSVEVVAVDGAREIVQIERVAFTETSIETGP